MQRRSFLQLSTLGSAAAAASALQLNAEAPRGKADPTLIGSAAVVMAPRADGAEILWRVNKLAKGYVEFGETKELGMVKRGDDWGIRPAGEDVIKVKLDGLKPDTQYFYRIVTKSFNTKQAAEEVGEVRSFRTLAPERSHTRFSVWNDTHEHHPTIEALNKATPPSDFLLWNGDISNDWHKAEQLPSSLLNPGGVDFTAQQPLVVLRGNHDLRGVQAHRFQDYVATPEGRPWTAFRSGPVAAICLDTGEDKPDDHPYLFGRVACEPMRREQAEWLEQLIEDPAFKDAPYKVVFCHIPLRWTDESGKHGYDYFSRRSRELWHDSLVKWGAQCIISGHTHRHAMLPATEAFPYAQLVGGGPQPERATLIIGDADSNKLSLTITSLAGKTLHQLTLKPLS